MWYLMPRLTELDERLVIAGWIAAICRSCLYGLNHAIDLAVSHISREGKMISMFKANVFFRSSKLIVYVFLNFKSAERVSLSYYHTNWDTINLA